LGQKILAKKFSKLKKCQDKNEINFPNLKKKKVKQFRIKNVLVTKKIADQIILESKIFGCQNFGVRILFGLVTCSHIKISKPL